MEAGDTKKHTTGEGPETWVDRHGDFLYRYALSRVRDPAVAEEVVQEAFLSAIGAQERFDGRSSLRTWLTGILRHKILDHHRRISRKYARETSLDSDRFNPSEMFDSRGEWIEKPGIWAEAPEQLYDRGEFMTVLAGCISAMPDRLASVFTMKEMEGEESEKICKDLEVSANNLWVMLYRARQSLRRCLGKNWFKEGED